MRHSSNNLQAPRDRTAKRNDWPSALLNCLLDCLFPATCLVCNVATKNTCICKDCLPQLKKQRQLCKLCGSWDIQIIEETSTCYPCLVMPFSARHLRSACLYDRKTRNFIRTLKYKKKFVLAKELGLLLASSINLFPKTNWDLVIALPSSKVALRERGFSHMHLALKAFSKATKIPKSLFALSNVSKSNYQSLTELNKRSKNVLNSFTANTNVLSGKKILLIDDVITTGTSAESACRAVLEAGAISVDVLSLARSPNFSKNRQNHIETL